MIRFITRSFRFTVAFIVVLLMTVESSAAGNKYALFVGVDTYDSGLRRLVYAEKDAKVMSEAFARLGFRVITMTRDQDLPARRPSTAVKIMTQIRSRLKDLRPEDTVVIFFSGHGIQFTKPQKLKDGTEETHFFCPEETNLKDPDSMVPVNQVYAMIEQCAAERKLLLVDACRDQPLEETAKAVINIELAPAGLTPRTVPKGILALYSCAEGEQSQEAPEFKHGAFCYHLLQYVQGNADPKFYTRDKVSLRGLTNYASIETRDYVLDRLGKDQTPESVGRLTDWDLGRIPLPDLWTNSLGMKFQRIPSGTFLMGSNETKEELQAVGLPIQYYDGDSDGNDRPQHRVTIGQEFHMGIHEVTRSQFAAFIQATGYETDAKKNGLGVTSDDAKKGATEPKSDYHWKATAFPQQDNHPVVSVSWNDANAFYDWLSSQDNTSYRLPTEAEWEYACRAGTTTRYSTGDAPGSLQGFGNVQDASYESAFPSDNLAKYPRFKFNDGYTYTSPVGSFKPNAFGLYDMHGNVYEWCQDDPRKYEDEEIVDPNFVYGRGYRIYRGGNWSISPERVQSSSRSVGLVDYNNFGLGFRLVRIRRE